MWIGQVGSDVRFFRSGEDEVRVEQHRLEKGQAARPQEVVDVGAGDIAEEVGDRGQVQLFSHVFRDIRGIPDDIVYDRIVEGVGDVTDGIEDVAYLGFHYWENPLKGPPLAGH